MKILNYCPHPIIVGDITYQSEGIARVSVEYSPITEDGFCQADYGKVTGLPHHKKNTVIIVSAMVKSASRRRDLVVPATGHPDAVRNDKGQIVSVPCLIK